MLTTTEQISEMTAAQARREYPVRIRGVVTYADMKLGHAFIQDGTAATFAYFDPANPQPRLTVGDLVEVRGVTTPGDFSSCVRAVRFTIVGRAPLPRPKRLAFSQLISGRWVCYWAELEGVIRSAKVAEGSLEIDLAMEDGKVLVIIPEYPNWQRTLVGAHVLLRGPLSALYNDHRQARGVKLFVPGPKHISVIEPGPQDPYQLPAISPSGIGRYDVIADLAAETRVRGTVDAVEPGHLLYVSDAESTIAVESYSSCSPRTGDLVDVIGFRGLVDGRPGLVNADCRFVGQGLSREAVAVIPQRILETNAEPSGDPTVFLYNSTRYDLRLIRTEGTLVQASRGPEGVVLVLESEGTEFSALFPKANVGLRQEPSVGSLLRLTGLCVIHYDSYSRPLAFRLVLRRPSDIVVLREPPYWTPHRLLLALAIAISTTVSWIALLRKRVRRQTIALNQAKIKEQAINQLTRTMQEVTLRKDFSSRVPVSDCPEIATLGTEFNNMLSELHESDLARKEAESKLRDQALTDELTGLPNRRVFTDSLGRTLGIAERANHTMAVLYLDLDGFKLVNDSLGHRIGDVLLANVAERMRSRVRKADTLARIGGDEFAIVLTVLKSKEEARSVAASLLEILSRPFSIEGHEVRIGASIGISLFPENSNTAGELLQQADSAMYAAKRNGKNQIVYFTPGIGASMRERQSMEHQLRGALSRGEIDVHYQPEFDLRSGRIIRFEALARWNHPILGNIPPATFIPIAEESGLIVALGAHILRRACTEALKWQAHTPDPIQLAVNISSVQFNRESFVGELTEVLRETGLSAKLLQIELTESVMLHRAERTADTMKELRALGISIAIDDFGTGYSSVSYLNRLPFSELKVDRAFVAELGTRKEASAILGFLVTLAHKCNVQVVVEGVETLEQLATIKQLGANHVQGYLLGRPMPNPLAQMNLSQPAQQITGLSLADSETRLDVPVQS